MHLWLDVENPHVGYYDRCGNRIPMVRWTELHQDWGYKRVAETFVAGVWRVSTVWLGLDHGLFSGGPPVIFETMVFEVAESYDNPYLPVYHDNVFDDFCARYSTETQAREGHAATVREARQMFLPAVLDPLGTI